MAAAANEISIRVGRIIMDAIYSGSFTGNGWQLCVVT